LQAYHMLINFEARLAAAIMQNLPYAFKFLEIPRFSSSNLKLLSSEYAP